MKDYNINFSIRDICGKTKSFTTLRSLCYFLGDEVAAWKEYKKIIKSESSLSQSNLHNLLSFENYVSGFLKSTNELLAKNEELDNSDIDQRIKQLKQSNLRDIGSRWLWSGHPFVENLVELHKKYDAAAIDAFLNVVSEKQPSFNPHSHFLASMAGYEYLVQNSDVVKRRRGEKISLGRLRNSFEEARDTLFSETEEKGRKLDEWIDEKKAESERLYFINKAISERRAARQIKEFDKAATELEKRAQELESLYEEKLRLEKPAEYWKQASRKYLNQGRCWVGILLAFLIAGLGGSGFFFSAWLRGQEIGVSLNTLQGVVIFGSIVAVYAFLIKVVSRLVFSSFHLMRDAEEREQLTYLYLSLTKESEVDKESRDIVLQSLFSRTDTGLLSGDSSPAMPVVADMVRSVAKGKGQS